MKKRTKKPVKKINLLELSGSEKALVLRQIRKKLRNQVAEVKLWQSLLDAENVIVNGNCIYNEATRLSAFRTLGKT